MRIETGVAVTDVFGMDGRVEGVVCGDRRIAARRGVVFATGGFAHSQDLMTRSCPFRSVQPAQRRAPRAISSGSA